MKKRGQVTLFVIVGIVVFLTALIFLYLFSIRSEEIPANQGSYLRNYEGKLEPIRSEIGFCLESLGKDAFVKLGLQGGYIDIDPQDYRTDAFPEYLNTAVEVFPDSGIIIPFWSRLDSKPDCTDCKFRFEFPPLEGPGNTIQAQAEKYIEDNLLECLNNFEQFEDTIAIEYSKPNVDIFFDDKDTFIGLNFPINISFYDSDQQFNMDVFNSKIDLRMKDIYALSEDIFLQSILVDSVLESFSLKVTDFAGMGRDMVIPPRAASIKAESGFKLWKKSDVRDILRGELAENINYIQIIGSFQHSMIFGNDPVKNSLYRQFLYTLSTKQSQLERTKIRFNYYPDWPLYVNIHPGQGEVIMPESLMIDLFITTIMIFDYDFSYDLSFPVVVSLEDPGAFDGEGYLFQYAVESNIRRSSGYGNTLPSAFLEAQNQQLQQFIDNDLRNVPVRVTVLDGFTLTPLPDIVVSYSCGDEEVNLGVTEIRGGSAYLETLSTSCLNGFLGIRDLEYKAEAIPANILESKNNVYVLKAFKEEEVDVYFEKNTFANFGAVNQDSNLYEAKWTYRPNPVSVDSNELLTVRLELLDKGQPTGSSQVIFFNSSMQKATVKLVPGDYNLQVLSVSEFDTYVIPELIMKPECGWLINVLGWFGAGECPSEIPIDSVELKDSMMVGYLLFDNTTSGPITVSKLNLQKNSMIIKYAGYDLRDVNSALDLVVVADTIDASKTYRNSLLPEFE